MTNLNTEIFNKIFMHLPGPQALWVFGTFAAISMIYRLLAEWQRRMTLDHIFTHAPGGSVIFQEKGLAGPAMSVWVGNGPYPPPDTVHLVIHPSTAWQLPPGGGDW